jgi:GT2 family glycosyltransferase
MDVATGGCMLIRKSMLKSIRLFDEGFFFCGEDYDLCFRARIAGFKIMYCPTAIVWHKFLGSGKQSFNSLFAHYRGKFRFMLIHATIIQLFVFLPVQIVIGIRYFRPLFAALFWNIKNLPSAIESRRKVHRLKLI